MPSCGLKLWNIDPQTGMPTPVSFPNTLIDAKEKILNEILMQLYNKPTSLSQYHGTLFLSSVQLNPLAPSGAFHSIAGTLKRNLRLLGMEPVYIAYIGQSTQENKRFIHLLIVFSDGTKRVLMVEVTD